MKKLNYNIRECFRMAFPRYSPFNVILSDSYIDKDHINLRLEELEIVDRNLDDDRSVLCILLSDGTVRHCNKEFLIRDSPANAIALLLNNTEQKFICVIIKEAEEIRLLAEEEDQKRWADWEYKFSPLELHTKSLSLTEGVTETIMTLPRKKRGPYKKKKPKVNETISKNRVSRRNR